jgi:Protein of unknown function (DUF3224)
MTTKSSPYMPNTLILVLALLASAGAGRIPAPSPPQNSNAKDTTQMNAQKSAAAAAQSQSKAHQRTHATARITAHNSEPKPFDQTGRRSLMEIHLTETFAGDIDGGSTVQALEIRRADRSASLLSMQRFRGKLGGRHGTFVLQGSETVENGKIKAKWFVVPGSGTGDLSGLRGTGGFEGDFGKGSAGSTIGSNSAAAQRRNNR